jgi:heme-degrading monooxygenase HmoA
MFARNIVYTGTDVDRAVEFLDKEAAPVVSQQKGFAQLAAAGDRAAGVVSILSVWETLEDLQASESAMAKVRQEGVGRFGGELASVDVFEQVVMEVGKTPPQPGCVIRIQSTRLDVGAIDEIIGFFRTEILPGILGTPGLRAVRNLINRQTGEGRISVVFSDQAALEAGDSARQARMAKAGERGVQFGEARILEVLYGRMAS